MGRKSSPRGIDVSNMIVAYQTIIVDTEHAIANDTNRTRNAMRTERIKHYRSMITRLASSGAYARPKQVGSRLILCVCPSCGYKVRTTMHWISLAIPRCPQKKIANPAYKMDRAGGYSIGCKEGGRVMEFETARDKEVAEEVQEYGGREEMAAKDEKTRAKKRVRNWNNFSAKMPVNGRRLNHDESEMPLYDGATF